MPTISVLKRLGNRAKAPQPGHLPGEGLPNHLKRGIRPE